LPDIENRSSAVLVQGYYSMVKTENSKIRFLRNIISCIVYIAAFTFVEALISVIISSILKGHSRSLTDPGYWIEQFENNVHSSITYITCQIIAASLIIRELSLKKLFTLTCIFIIISQLFEALLSNSFELIILWNFVIIVLPYVAPVLILAVISRKKTIPVIVSDVKKEILTSIESETDIQQQTKDDRKSVHSRYWYILDIILISVVLYWGNLLDPFGLVSYISGLYNRYTLFSSGFTYALLIVPASLCLLVLIWRMFVSWPKYISNKPKLRSFQIIIPICLFVYLVLPFLPVLPAPKRIYMAGFEGYAKNNADIDGIRHWLNSLTREDFIEYERKGRTLEWREKIDWPQAILKLHPGSAGLSWDKNYKPKVSLSWGSGVVGPWGFGCS
jgi:hypothetical protein